MIAAETIGRLNFCSQLGPFGLFVSAFISVPLLPDGICVFGIVEVAGGIVVVLPGVIVPFVVVFAHGLPFSLVACAPGLLEFTGLAFVLAGVFGETGGALVFGVVELTDVLVFVLAPVVPLPGVVLVTVLLVQLAGAVDGVVVVVAGGGLVWAKAGADSPAIRLAALAKPRILAPTVMRRFSPREAIKEMPTPELPKRHLHYEEREPARSRLPCTGKGLCSTISVCAPRPALPEPRPAGGNGGTPYVTT